MSDDIKGLKNWETRIEGNTSKTSPSYMSTEIVMESGHEVQIEVCEQSWGILENEEEIQGIMISARLKGKENIVIWSNFYEFNVISLVCVFSIRHFFHDV